MFKNKNWLTLEEFANLHIDMGPEFVFIQVFTDYDSFAEAENDRTIQPDFIISTGYLHHAVLLPKWAQATVMHFQIVDGQTIRVEVRVQSE